MIRMLQPLAIEVEVSFRQIWNFQIDRLWATVKMSLVNGYAAEGSTETRYELTVSTELLQQPGSEILKGAKYCEPGWGGEYFRNGESKVFSNFSEVVIAFHRTTINVLNWLDYKILGSKSEFQGA
jgi:hypothetical protein